MKTTSRFPRLRGFAVSGAVLLIASTGSVRASAGQSDGDRHELRKRSAVKAPRCYVMSSVSAIPTRCNRLGGIPTTTIPILIIGNHGFIVSR